MLEDIIVFTRLEELQKIGCESISSIYYKVLVEDFATTMRRKNYNLIQIGSLGKSEEWEQKVWRKVFYQGLDTRVQAFHFKLVHGALPTLEVMAKYSNSFHNSSCHFCKEVFTRNVLENQEHIFITCCIARTVWHVINDRLRNNGLETIVIEKENLFYKADMSTPHAFFISEVMWALWKNRCKNLYENEK